MPIWWIIFQNESPPKNYISNALKDHNAYNHSQFLEKIVQLEVTLPYYKKQILSKKLTEKLKVAFDEEYHTKIDEALIGSSAVAPVQLGDWLDTMRDVTRLANSIIMNLSSLLGEVDVSDFIRIEILRLKYPSVYEILFKQKHLLFKASNNGGSEMKYELAYTRDQFDAATNSEKNEKYLTTYLRKHASELNIPTNAIETITEYVQSIFADSLTYGYYSKKFLSIVNASKFDRYFAYGLLADELSEIEFTETINSDQATLDAKITEWVSRGLTYEVQKRFMNIKSFNNREEFEKIVQSIFHLANHPNQKGSYPTVVGYEGKDLFDKVNDYNGRIADTFYANNGKKEGLRTFIHSLFDKAKIPYAFESEFAKFVNAKLFDKAMFPLTKEEIKKISVDYLEKYCNATTHLNMEAFYLLWNTEQTNYEDLGGGSLRGHKMIPQEAKDIFKSLISKDLDDFIFRTIEVEPFHQKSFTIAKSAEDIYNGWGNFKTFILTEEESKWKYLAEFKTFYLEAEKGNFSHYVPFDFKTIPVESKKRNED